MRILKLTGICMLHYANAALIETWVLSSKDPSSHWYRTSEQRTAAMYTTVPLIMGITLLATYGFKRWAKNRPRYVE